jgi:hypothetical protein
MLRWIANTLIRAAIAGVRGNFLRRYPLAFAGMWLFDRYRQHQKSIAPQ